MLVIGPQRLFDANSAVRRILLEADLGKLLDTRYTVERRIYRWHRIVGGLVLGGAAASLALLIFLAADPRSLPLRHALGRFGFRSIVAVAGAVALILLTFGFCLLVRPSLLKGLESAANRWVPTTPRASPVHIDISRTIVRRRRLVGAALVIGGLFCLWPL